MVGYKVIPTYNAGLDGLYKGNLIAKCFKPSDNLNHFYNQTEQALEDKEIKIICYREDPHDVMQGR